MKYLSQKLFFFERVRDFFDEKNQSVAKKKVENPRKKEMFLAKILYDPFLQLVGF